MCRYFCQSSTVIIQRHEKLYMSFCCYRCFGELRFVCNLYSKMLFLFFDFKTLPQTWIKRTDKEERGRDERGWEERREEGNERESQGDEGK